MNDNVVVFYHSVFYIFVHKTDLSQLMPFAVLTRLK